MLFRRDLERTPVPMDRDTHLHFLRILRDGADLQGLEAYTTDPVRFVHREEVDWSDPDWVGDAPNQTSVGTPPPATANGVRREVEGVAPSPSKDKAARTNAPTKTYYDVLQVRPEAEPKAIKAAYRWFAIKYQPDVAFDPDVARQMAELKAAYSVLGDPIRRKRYDAELLWGVGMMDTSESEGSPGTPAEATGNLPPVHRAFARKLGLVLGLVLVAAAAGVGGLSPWNGLQEKRLESIVSQTHDWPPDEVALEPGAKFKVTLRTRCSSGQLDYVLTLVPLFKSPQYSTDKQQNPPPPDGPSKVLPPIDPWKDYDKGLDDFRGATERAIMVAAKHFPLTLHFFDKDGFDRLSFSVPLAEFAKLIDSDGHPYDLNANGKAACRNETYLQFTSCDLGWKTTTP